MIVAFFFPLSRGPPLVRFFISRAKVRHRGGFSFGNCLLSANKGMGRREKLEVTRNHHRKVGSRNKGSDDSDADYVVEEDDVAEEEGLYGLDEYASDASGDSFSRFDEDEEDTRVVRSMPRRGSLACRPKKVGVKTLRKRKGIVYEEEDEDYDYSDEYCSDSSSEGSFAKFKEVDDDIKFARSRRQTGSLVQKRIGVKPSRKRKRISYEEGDGDNDDDDEEFTPDDEFESQDEEEELPVIKKKKNKASRKRSSTRRREGTSNFSLLKMHSRKKGRTSTNQWLWRKATCNNNVEIKGRNSTARVKIKKPSNGKRRYTARSDSDFMSSASSDFEFTISEEEREQVREAGKFCRLVNCLRGSSSLQRSQEDEILACPQRKSLLGGKGKEKVEDPKNEDGKKLCGICFSEEGKRTVRGMLNCCNHYFCFACIMEWSMVESRCPLCKQRFATISKLTKPNAGVDSRNVVIQVPKRDQVYQPSEEELRSYLDPYEHMICTECSGDGDDNLMLLCDICDSPAHTYCVGLGREVPEGDWYCQGCMPVGGLESSDFQAQSPHLNLRTLPVEVMRESLEPISSPSPRTPFSHGTALPNSSAYRDVQPFSPVSGAGPSTVSGRRWLLHQINRLLSSNRTSQTAVRTNDILEANSTSDLSNSQSQDRSEPTFQCARTPEIGTSQHAYSEEQIQDTPSPFSPNKDLLTGRVGLFRRQLALDSSRAATNGSVNSKSPADLSLDNSISGSQALNEWTRRASFGSLSQSHTPKEQLWTMVENHLKILTRNVDLGHNTFKDVARRSMHTVFAACGLEQRTSDFCPVHPPSVCSHIEMMSGGHMSLVKGCCSSCFSTFVRNVVTRIMWTHHSHFF